MTAILFAILLVVITFGLVWPMAGPVGDLIKFYHPPALASLQGANFDKHFLLSMVMCAIIMIPAQLGLAFAIVRYKDRSGAKAVYSHGNNMMEIMWTSLALVFFIGMNVLGQGMWAEQRFTQAPPDSLVVEVTGEQFAWNIRYPGADGKFGKTDFKLIDNSAGNPLGLDPEDPVGKDDIVSPSLVVPVNKPLHVLLHAKDVTHNFFVAEMRIKQDAVPGMEMSLHFTPSVEGHYEIACSELCGLGHYKMRSYMEVVSPEKYQQWLKEHAR